MSKRKSTTNSKLKAANQQERIKLWKQNFENLQGNPPKVTHEPITRIISKQLDIKLGPFTQEELQEGVLQDVTLALYLFIICLDYVLRTSIDKIRENGFELTKKRSRRYPAKTITDADYADDIAILANTPNQAETLLHSLNEPPQVLTSMSMHTKRNICALIKQVTFLH